MGDLSFSSSGDRLGRVSDWLRYTFRQECLITCVTSEGPVTARGKGHQVKSFSLYESYGAQSKVDLTALKAVWCPALT